MQSSLVAPLRWLDGQLSAAALSVRPERPALLSFIFHGLFRNRQDTHDGSVDPYQPVLVDEFRAFIRHFIDSGYRFVRPADILDDLDPAGRHALITFDDGYANNLLALPVLREFGVPATVFVSSNHVVEGKGFWWDALYRERRRRGANPVAITAEQEALKRRTFRDIERCLVEEFGPAVLTPRGETDRPMTPDELRALAADPLVVIGNHTADHAILTVHDTADIRDQIRRCQDQIAAITGKAPTMIAYPNGRYDERVLAVARAEGLTSGVAVRNAKARLPLDRGEEMTLPRVFLRGGPSIIEQCILSRCDLRPLAAVRSLLARSAP